MLNVSNLNRFEQALTLGYGGEQARAIELLDALMREVPDNENQGWLLLHKAMFLAQIERVGEARERLNDLRLIWEDTPHHQARIAVADAMFDEAEGRASSNLAKLNRILKSYRELWKEADARDLYQEVQFNRGRLEATIGDWSVALPVLEECLDFERIKAAEFYYHLGYCYFEADQLEKAQEFLDLALAKNHLPKFSVAAHFYLGRLYNNLGAPAQALREFEIALSEVSETGTPRAAIYTELAQTCEALGLKHDPREYLHLAKRSE